MKYKLLKIIVGSLSTALVIFITMYLTLPYSLPYILTYFLKKNGFTQISFEIPHVDSSNLEITEIDLTKKISHEGKPAHNINIQIKNLNVEYKISSLLTGKLSSLSLTNAQINILSDDLNKSSNKASNSLLSNYLPTQWLSSIPLHYLSINNACLFWNKLPTQDNMICLNSQSTVANNTLSTHFNLTDNTTSLVLKAYINNNDQFNMIVYKNNKEQSPIININSTIKAINNNVELQGLGNINIVNTHELIDKWAIKKPTWLSNKWGALSNGNIDIEFTGEIPKNTLLSIENILQSAQLSGKVNFKLSSKIKQSKTELNNLFAHIAGYFKLNSTGIYWKLGDNSTLQFQANLYQLHPAFTNITSNDDFHSIELFITSPIEGTIKNDKGQLNIALLSGDILLDIATNTNNAQLALSVNKHQPGHINTTFQLKGNWQKDAKANPSIESLSWNLSGSLNSNRQVVNIIFNSESLIKANKLHTDKIKIDNTELTIKSPISLDYNYKANTLSTSNFISQVTASAIIWDNNKINSDSLILDIYSIKGKINENISLNGKINIHNTRGIIADYKIPSSHIGASINLENSKFKSSIKLTALNNQINLKGIFFQDFEKNNGYIDINLPQLFFQKDKLTLRHIIHPWNYPFDVTGGEISIQTHTVWSAENQPIKTSFTIKSNNLSGFYEDNEFNNLTTELNFINSPHWYMPTKNKIALDAINIGIPISKISLLAKLDARDNSSLIKITDFTANLLGGKATAKELIWDSGLAKNILPINLYKIDIKEIVELGQKAGLEGTGLIDGTLPIIITKQGITIKQGQLHARQPGGIIRYNTGKTDNTIISGKYNANYVMGLLNNFHYNDLNVSVEYSPNGTLSIPLKLKGINPDIDDRPVHFNINLELNLPNLLKSLKLADKIGETISEELLPISK